MKVSRKALSLLTALVVVLLLQSCASIQQNAPKVVWFKIAHLARVHMIQPGPSNPAGNFQYDAANSDGFWAVFEVCSIDVQGSALTNGFDYNSGNFAIPWVTGEIGGSSPGIVSRSDAKGLPMPNPEVFAAVSIALESGPGSLHLAKGTYIKPGYRFAIFVDKWPVGYMGEAMNLHYNGQPEVAGVVQNFSVNKPQEIPFYNNGVSPGIPSNCP
jgi:hypothetical protein